MDMIHNPDEFKKLEQIHEPDSRVRLWQGDPKDHLESFHREIDQIKLKDYVPLEIKREFEKSKNILLYSFFSYSMSTVAITHAYACVEKAITEKAQRLKLVSEEYNYKGKELLSTSAGLNRRINFALDRRWLGKKHFFLIDHNENEIDEDRFKDRLKWWVDFRNSLAHNPSFLNILWRVPEHLQLFANIINAIAKYNEPINSEIPEIELPRKIIYRSALSLILMKQYSLLEFIPHKLNRKL